MSDKKVGSDVDGGEREELYVCRVIFVGMNAAGDRDVTLVWQGGNLGSAGWPEWAWEIAKDALLHGKKVVVKSEGPPASNTFSSISLTDQDAADTEDFFTTHSRAQ